MHPSYDTCHKTTPSVNNLAVPEYNLIMKGGFRMYYDYLYHLIINYINHSLKFETWNIHRVSLDHLSNHESFIKDYNFEKKNENEPCLF